MSTTQIRIQSSKVKTAIIIITLLVVICIGVVVMGSVFLFDRQSQPERVFSPSGKRVLIPTINMNKEDITKYLCIHIEIQDVSSGETLFEEQTGASNRMRWSTQWINENLIQLNSSDIGNYCWQESVNKTWIEVQCLN